MSLNIIVNQPFRLFNRQISVFFTSYLYRDNKLTKSILYHSVTLALEKFVTKKLTRKKLIYLPQRSEES